MKSLISRDKKYCLGQYRIRGTRITVWCLKSWYNNGEGWDIESIQKLYPQLSKEQVKAAINFKIKKVTSHT